MLGSILPNAVLHTEEGGWAVMPEYFQLLCQIQSKPWPCLRSVLLRPALGILRPNWPPVCLKAGDLSSGESFDFLPAMWSAEKAWMEMLLVFPSEISLLVTTFAFPFLSRGNLWNLMIFPSIWSTARTIGWDILTRKLRKEWFQASYFPGTLSSAARQESWWDSPFIYYIEKSRRQQALWYFFGCSTTCMYAPGQLNQTFHQQVICQESSGIESVPIQWNGRPGLAKPHGFQQVQWHVGLCSEAGTTFGKEASGDLRWKRRSCYANCCCSTDNRQCKQERPGLSGNPWAPGVLRACEQDPQNGFTALHLFMVSTSGFWTREQSYMSTDWVGRWIRLHSHLPAGLWVFHRERGNKVI